MNWGRLLLAIIAVSVLAYIHRYFAYSLLVILIYVVLSERR
jgi:hypothetical protein